MDADILGISVADLPDGFTHTVRATFGAEGERFLQELPVLVDEVRARWGLVVGGHFENLTFNYVAPARLSDGTEAVLKIGVPPPANREVVSECAALALAGGRGMVRLLNSWPDKGVLLLERVRPGTTLRAELAAGRISERDATVHAATVMRLLRNSPPETHSFPTVAEWFQGFERLRRSFQGGTGPFPHAVVDVVEELYRSLSSSATDAVVLHGDLHHDNILSAAPEGWRAIDPKGLVGEPAYEAGAFLRNPFDLYSDPSRARSTLAERLTVLEQHLELPASRMLSWAAAQAVLCAWWCYEDSGSGWDSHLRTAGIMLEALGTAV